MTKIFKNKSINKVNFISIVFGSILLTLFIILAVYNSYSQYKNDIQKLETDYIISQKKFIEQETKRALSFIKYKHERNKDLPIEKLQEQIVEVIENMRSKLDGSGYIFIYTFDGINIADPIQKNNAGKNLIDFKDPNGKKVIYELIQASQNPNGGYVNYVWNKPTTNELEEKISYAISYKPWNWMIGSGVYLDNIQGAIKEKKDKHYKQISQYLVQIFLISILLFFVGIVVYKHLLSLIQNDIELIRKSSKELNKIDNEQISFNEFKQVAKHINSMQESLQDLNKNLEQKVAQRTKELEASEKYARKLVYRQDKFVKDAIHEINTPLSIIITNIDLFKLKISDNKYLSKIEAGAKIIHNIYNDLEYVVKKDRIEYTPKKIDLSSFLEFRVDFFNEIATGNSLSLKANIQDNIEVLFNETLLQRICDNTLSNAIKYSYEKSEVIINLYEKDSNITLEFINSGKTIENVDKLFDRFYRENQSRGGFGLGLNIIKEICDKFGVQLDVVSENEQTTFRYTIVKGIDENITS